MARCDLVRNQCCVDPFQQAAHAFWGRFWCGLVIYPEFQVRIKWYTPPTSADGNHSPLHEVPVLCAHPVGRSCYVWGHSGGFWGVGLFSRDGPVRTVVSGVGGGV